MTEEDLEKKLKDYSNKIFWQVYKESREINTVDISNAYKDGYEQGHKDFDTDVTKLLNSYGVTFIDTNFIGGLIDLHQIILDLEKENEELKWEQKQILEDNESYQKENEELKAIISKLKCCGNCKHWRYSCLNEDYICKRTEEIIKSLECYTEKMDKCDKWELAK